MEQQQIIEAIQNNDIDRVRELLNKKPQLAEIQTPSGLSIIQLSAYLKNEELTSLLLNHKKELDLFEACAIGKINAVKKQIEKNPGLLGSFSNDGFTPLGLACYFGHHEIADFLIKKGAQINIASKNGFEVTPLHSAVAGSHLAIVKLLLDNGANPNAEQIAGIRPLHAAAHKGESEIVELLLKNGADPNARNEEGKTAADLAMGKALSLLQ